MNTTRRTVLKGATASGLLAGLIAAGALRPTQVFAAEWNKAAFEAKDTAGALKGLGAAAPADSKDLVLKVPDIAENGAVVPVGCATTLPGVKRLLLLVEGLELVLLEHLLLQRRVWIGQQHAAHQTQLRWGGWRMSLQGGRRVQYVDWF